MGSFKIGWVAARATPAGLRGLSKTLNARGTLLLVVGAACLVPTATKWVAWQWSVMLLVVATAVLLCGARQLWWARFVEDIARAREQGPDRSE